MSARILSPTHRRELRGGRWLLLWIIGTVVFAVILLASCHTDTELPAPSVQPIPAPAPNTPEGCAVAKDKQQQPKRDLLTRAAVRLIAGKQDVESPALEQELRDMTGPVKKDGDKP